MNIKEQRLEEKIMGQVNNLLQDVGNYFTGYDTTYYYDYYFRWFFSTLIDTLTNDRTKPINSKYNSLFNLNMKNLREVEKVVKELNKEFNWILNPKIKSGFENTYNEGKERLIGEGIDGKVKEQVRQLLRGIFNLLEEAAWSSEYPYKKEKYYFERFYYNIIDIITMKKTKTINSKYNSLFNLKIRNYDELMRKIEKINKEFNWDLRITFTFEKGSE